MPSTTAMTASPLASLGDAGGSCGSFAVVTLRSSTGLDTRCSLAREGPSMVAGPSVELGLRHLRQARVLSHEKVPAVAVAGAVAVAIWTGEEFTAAEDVQDFTAIGGVPFARSGLIRFALPSNVCWSSVYDTSEIDELDDLVTKANITTI